MNAPASHAQFEKEIRQTPANVEAEQAVLGTLLCFNNALPKVDFLKEEDFSEELHRRIFEITKKLIAEGKLASPITLRTYLGDHDLGGMPISQYLARLASSAAPPAAVSEYAQAVSDLARRRDIIAAGQRMLDIAYDAPVGQAPAIIAASAAQTLQEIARSGVTTTTRVDAGNGASALLERGKAIRSGSVTREAWSTGFTDIDASTGGYEPGLLWIIGARPSMGKAQPLNAKVRMRSGWKVMADIKVGDVLASVDGAPSFVTGVFPQGRKAVYLVSFSDGRCAEASSDHLWLVNYRGWPTPRVLTTGDLLEKLTRVRYKDRLWITPHNGILSEPVEAALPLHPWVLGALIGNGCFRDSSVHFSNLPDENVAKLSTLLPDGVSVTKTAISGYDYRIVEHGCRKNSVLDALRSLGLSGLKSTEKFIPSDYMNGSQETRAAVLQGLLDTDGWVEKFGAVRFATSSPLLADNVCELARSLGYWAKPARRRAYVYKNGSREQKADSYNISISGKNLSELFSLPRKIDRITNRSRYRALTISRVEFARFDECQCISVSHPSSLYITDDYVVTHNTTYSIASALRTSWLATRGKENGCGAMVFSLEDDERQAMARALAMRAYNDREPIEYRRILAARDLGEDEMARLAKCSEEFAGMPLTFDFGSRPTVEQIGHKIRMEKDRMAKSGHRLGVVFVDYLKKVAASGRYAGNRNLEFGEITGKMKDIARDEQVCMVLFSQLNRATEQSPDKRPTLANLRDSGEIEEDGNIVAFLHRENYYILRSAAFKKNEPEAIALAAETERELEFIIEKNKAGPIGTRKLFCNLGCNYISNADKWGR